MQAVLWKTNPAAEIERLFTSTAEMSLSSGFTRSLTAKLADALAALSASDSATACDALASFISQATAQSGKKITREQAEDLIAPAADVRAMLQCP